MKKMTCLLGLVFFTNSLLPAQHLADVDTGKYRINLPGFWKPGNKVWGILIDKLPTICSEVADKELCGDHCNPRYRIEFVMSEPEVFDHHSYHISSGNSTQTWGFTTYYRFFAALLLYNEKNELLTKFILVDTNESWRITNTAQLQSYRSAVPRLPNMLTLVNTNPYMTNEQLWRYATGINTPNQSPHDYINKNRDKLAPTDWDLIAVVDEKIRSWE